MNPLAVVLMLAMLATAGVLFVGLVGFFVRAARSTSATATG